MAERTDRNKREQWLIRNTTRSILSIGDLDVPTVEPGRTIDLLLYTDKTTISQSSNLAELLDAGWLTLNKRKDSAGRNVNRSAAKSSVQTTEENELNAVDTRLSDKTQYMSSAGKLRYGSSVPEWDDMRVPVTTGKTGAANPPTFTKFADDGSGSYGIWSYAFSQQAVAGNEEQLFFTVQLPHSYALGTDLDAHIHWSPTTNNAGVVRWGLEYALAPISGDFPANSSIIYADSDGITNDQNKHILTDIGDISGSLFTGVSGMLMCRIFRNSSHGNDTYGDSAMALEMDFHIQLDSLGSLQETSKN